MILLPKHFDDKDHRVLTPFCNVANIIPLNAFQKCLGKSGLDQHYKVTTIERNDAQVALLTLPLPSIF